jgi:hypothetical protein
LDDYIDTKGGNQTFAAVAKTNRLPEESGRSRQKFECTHMKMPRKSAKSPYLLMLRNQRMAVD